MLLLLQCSQDRQRTSKTLEWGDRDRFQQPSDFTLILMLSLQGAVCNVQWWEAHTGVLSFVALISSSKSAFTLTDSFLGQNLVRLLGFLLCLSVDFFVKSSFSKELC